MDQDHSCNAKSMLLLGLVGMIAFYCCRYLPLVRSEPPFQQEFHLKIPASGYNYLCFPEKGCNYDIYAHADCDTHCRNRTFQMGACSKVYYYVSPAGSDLDYLCCCYAMMPTKDQ